MHAPEQSYGAHMCRGTAVLCAATFKIGRAEQDAFALASYQRALKAQQGGGFRREIVPVKVSRRSAEELVLEDEEPARINVERLPGLKPAFEKDGTVTAGNASSISDGAAALVVMSGE
jgi:acetyl-CoA C-acetyltransferase